MPTFSWSDIDEIAYQLFERHPDTDPVAVKFTDLRAMVEALDDFEAEPGQTVNEQILEAIQAGWIEERQDAEDDVQNAEEGKDDEESGYQPNQPFR